MYLRNAWYVGAWSHEVTNTPLQRWMLGEPLVFYRTEADDAVVLDDCCPHRFAPLSTGRVVGDALECGYHGFTFGPTGRCVFMPGMDKVPQKVGVRSFPVIERWGWVYVWMGDAEQADEALLPDFHWMSDADWVGRGETLNVKANYRLIVDNLLDLTHAKYVHKSTLATDDVTEYPVITDVEDGKVVVRRNMDRVEKPSPFFARCGGFTQPVTHHQRIEFIPPDKILIKVGAFSVPDATEDKRVEFRVINALTPETESRTNYFWSLVRNFAPDDEEIDAFQFNGNRAAFEEDRAILEAQQRMMDSRPDAKSVVFPHDKGIFEAQKLMDRLMVAEQGTP